jgi:multiple sugar transport system permease protein
VTASTTVIAALGGYAVARLRFPGRESVASLILILYLIPPALLFIPLYRVLAEIGATDHLSALFLSYPTFTVPFWSPETFIAKSNEPTTEEFTLRGCKSPN